MQAKSPLTRCYSASSTVTRKSSLYVCILCSMYKKYGVMKKMIMVMPEYFAINFFLVKINYHLFLLLCNF